MKRPRPARRALLVVACLMPVIGIAAWQLQPPGRDTLATVTVTRGNIENSVTALGTLQPRRYVDVGAQASGQIRKIHVEAGDTVQEGQLLVEIDPSTQKAKLDASRYAIENLKAQLQEQKAQHALARQKYQRQQRLAAGNATREEDVQTAKAELSATQARVGQTLNAQQRTPLILRIAKLSPMTVWAEVSEADIGHVKPGMSAYFTTLSGGNRRWTSSVRQVLPIPPKPLDETQGSGSPNSSSKNGSGRVVLYTVLLDVDNTDNALMAEMTTQVFFVASQVKDALTAPVAALQGSTEQQIARVVAKNGRIEERTVRLGISDRLRVEVLEGLSEGDHLLIGPVDGSGG